MPIMLVLERNNSRYMFDRKHFEALNVYISDCHSMFQLHWFKMNAIR